MEVNKVAASWEGVNSDLGRNGGRRKGGVREGGREEWRMEEGWGERRREK